MKRVRILLRVSSNQQLEADGDLTVQRKIVKEYIDKHEDWNLDKKEYFEGGVSGYKNSVSDRDELQEALNDAKNGEYDILAVYKDDRLGRRMWEIGAYVMQLKSYNVDIYTVKDGCISPNNDDIMGQMMLALRYGNAQKSSSDTGMRVKDTAQKLVQQGKFMGGKAPYGYKLILSGEISKHGRALHKLEIRSEQAEAVKYIYELSLVKEYGSSKIANTLNNIKKYKELAPNDFWKSGTVTSILTNPIYAGITAYKRREKINGKYHSLGSDEWITAKKINSEIAIIDIDTWNKTQNKRQLRSYRYKNVLQEKGINVLKRNDGMLPLIDVAYCGYCGRKLTNGSKYNYWTIKSTGEKRASKTPIYRCQNPSTGVPHDKTRQFKADKIENVVFEYIANYIGQLQDNSSVFEQICNNNNNERKSIQESIKKARKELQKIEHGIDVMKSHLPEAMEGNYPMTVETIASAIEQHENTKSEKEAELEQLERSYNNKNVESEDWERIRNIIPSWQEVFYHADKETKRVLINRIVDKIIITNEKITIKFKINIDKPVSTDDTTQPRISINDVVSKQGV